MEAELAGLRCAIYARFSSEGQSEASIDDQVRRCRQYIERHGGTFDEDLVFADRAVSGASMDRPMFIALSRLATASPPLVDVIVTEDLSRIGRDQADLHHFRRSLEYSRVRLIGSADGVDTAAAHGSLTFSMKGMVAEIYLRELRDKTLRGLEGRALAGYATGGVAYGYRLRKELGPDGKPRSVIEIDTEKKEVVRRIFRLYLDGHSLSAIACILNREKVPPPRVHAKNRRVGWKDSTIRAFLHNESYAGLWKYKEREWRKRPGTNERSPVQRQADQVMTQDRPHLRIVDERDWSAVQERLKAVRQAYTGKRKVGDGPAIPNRRSNYLFSSLLYCAVCGSRMNICGGGSASYYRCEGHTKRGICANGLCVREDVVRESILDELRRRLLREDALKEARERMAMWLGGLRRRRDAERSEVLRRVEKNEAQAERIVDAIAEGTVAGADVGTRLSALRRQVEADRKILASVEREAFAPVSLPTQQDVVKIVADMEARLRADPVRGREELRRYFEDARIELVPQPGRFYIAMSKFLPLVPLMQTPSEALGLGGRHEVSRSSASSCAGRI